MKTLKSLFIIICLVFAAQSCSKNMTIVKTHPKTGPRYSHSGQAPWQESYNSGLDHYQKKEYTKALEYYTLALKQAGDDDETRGWMYFSLGRCYEALKELGRAKQNYLMAQNLDPNLTEASDGIARISKQHAEKD